MTRRQRVSAWGLFGVMVAVSIALALSMPYLLQWVAIVPGYTLGAVVGDRRHAAILRREAVWCFVRNLATYRPDPWDQYSGGDAA